MTGSHRAVVGDLPHLVRRLVHEGHRSHRVDIRTMEQEVDDVVDVPDDSDRSGRAQVHDDVRLVAIRCEVLERMAEHVDVRGEIAGVLVRTPERHVCAPLLGRRRDLVVLRADDDAGDAPRFERLEDGPGDEGLAADLDEVLPRDALRAAAGGISASTSSVTQRSSQRAARQAASRG